MTQKVVTIPQRARNRVDAIYAEMKKTYPETLHAIYNDPARLQRMASNWSGTDLMRLCFSNQTAKFMAQESYIRTFKDHFTELYNRELEQCQQQPDPAA